MKKIIALISFTFLIFISCDLNFDDIEYKVINNSLKPISYEYNGYTETISTGEFKIYIINSGKGSYKPNYISFNGHPKSVILTHKSTGSLKIEYSFNDVIPYYLYIANSLPVDVTFKADDYIDNEDSTTITVHANNKNDSAMIYTNKPVFTLVSDPYPVIFDWYINDQTLYVSIR